MHKIAIIGCGPAGLSAAIALHDKGHAVSIFERFEKAGPVGSGLMLQPTGLAVLERFGLRDEVEAIGQRIDGMLGRIAPNGKIVLDIEYAVLSREMYGVAIHRAALFHVLFEAVASRSIPIHVNSEIDNLLSQPDYVQLIRANGELVDERYDLVVDASGSQSKLQTLANVPPSSRILDYGALWATVKHDSTIFNDFLLEQRYRAANIMVGVLPCGRLPSETQSVATFFWSLKNDSFLAVKEAGIDRWKEEVMQCWPAVETLLSQINHFDDLAYARYSHHTLSVPFSDRLVFIGDAAHSTSPQLGQGANMALLDSYALAQALDSDLSTRNSLQQSLENYAKIRRTHVRLYQAASYTLTPFYQSDSKLLPWLRDMLFEPVSKLPFASKIVTSLGAGLLASPVKKIEKIRGS